MTAATWEAFTWPDWVPAKVREQIENFWSPALGRGAAAWLADAAAQGGPPLGATVSLPSGFSTGAPLATGRFVHAWNNIGRLVTGPNEFVYTSFTPGSAPW